MANKILIVDDDKCVLSSIVRTLNYEGYSILTAQSGSEALDILDKNKIDIVIMDHLMPDITGLEALKIIKELYPHITRIMLTGNPDITAFIPAIKNNEIEHYISKPWNDENLKFRLQMITKGYKIDAPL